MINLWMLPSRQSFFSAGVLLSWVFQKTCHGFIFQCFFCEHQALADSPQSEDVIVESVPWPSPRWSQPRSRRSSPPTRILLAVGGTNSWGLTVIADKFFPAIHACFKHVPNTFSGSFVRLAWDSEPTLVQADYCITAKFSDHPGPHLAVQGLIMACCPCNSWKTTNRLRKTRGLQGFDGVFGFCWWRHMNSIMMIIIYFNC